MASSGTFPTTKWTLIDRLRTGNASLRREALEELCRAYWLPLYSFARRSGLEPADAEDAVQDFFLAAVEQDLLASAKEHVGRLRGLLGIAFKRHLSHRLRRERALCRGGRVEHVPWLPDDAEEQYLSGAGDTAASPDQLYHRQWARSVISRSQAALREWYESEGKGALFARLSAFLPAYTYEESQAQVVMAESVDMSAEAFRAAIFRMRKRLRQCIRDEVKETLHSSDPEVIDAEIRDLLLVLSE